jgi:hypothetical protein
MFATVQCSPWIQGNAVFWFDQASLTTQHRHTQLLFVHEPSEGSFSLLN